MRKRKTLSLEAGKAACRGKIPLIQGRTYGGIKPWLKSTYHTPSSCSWLPLKSQVLSAGAYQKKAINFI